MQSIPSSPIHSSESGRKWSKLLTVNGFTFVLFLAVMCWKCYWLNKTLSIPNMAFDLSDFSVTLGALFVIGGWTWWLPKHWRPLTLLILNILLTILLFSDLVYFRYFQDFITVPVLMQAFQVSALGDSIVSLISWKDYKLFLDWLIFIPLVIWQTRTLKQARRQALSSTSNYNRAPRRGWVRLLNGVLSLILGAVLLFVPIQHATTTWAKGVFSGNWWNASLYNITGLYGFHGYDIYRYARENWFSSNSISPEDEALVGQWFKEHEPMLSGPASTFGKYKGKNIIIVQAEAFENFVIGKSFNGQELTPNLNALLKESMYFNRFFHQTGQGRTSDADFGVQTSLHPLPTGSVFIRYPNHTYDAMPHILKENGYTTGAYHAYDAGFWNRYIVYNNLGYDFFMSRKDYTVDEPLGWSVGDKSFFRQSVERMAKEKQPFYSFMITLTSHHPYKLPTSVQKLDVAPYKDTIFGDYLEAVHYVDAAMGEFISDLKKNGLWDNSILMFYGDHDNSIPDREPLEKLLGHPVSDFQMLEMKNQVPLIVHLPGGAEAGTYDTVTGQLDLSPTVMHWLGITPADKHYMGSHIQAAGEHLIVLRNGSYTNGTIYYVPSADGIFENGTCYNYATGEPGDVAPCKPLHDEAMKRLTVSDIVITQDYIGRSKAAKP
ncbi:LTA synthase family protein [Paenibacillus sp. ACRRX]|uniref:LTA synthase family protein n=1 Tax=Paenibacillus sp. ACRRX TaxID=2918206 RepID=UPI001EF3E634|nr:LTA synthase family protein [Paenibacillus sp. ACRRX]MCG7405998.1 LTA synthase family protein [Paenibacillus sp. ACRRX]